MFSFVYYTSHAWLSYLPLNHVSKYSEVKYFFFFKLHSHLLFRNERILVFMVFSRPSASCSVWTTVDLLQRTVPVLLVSCFCSLPKAMSSCKHLDSANQLCRSHAHLLSATSDQPIMLGDVIRRAAKWTGLPSLLDVFRNV